jgi:Tol biopolymer transport system component
MVARDCAEATGSQSRGARSAETPLIYKEELLTKFSVALALPAVLSAAFAGCAGAAESDGTSVGLGGIEANHGPDSWSRCDARRTPIAFQSTVGTDVATFEIFRVRSDGSGLVQLTTTEGTGQSTSPDWTPDGRTIVFTRSSSTDATHDIWLMNADGSNQRNLTQTPGFNEQQPDVSPDGRQIVWFTDSHPSSTGARQNDLYVMNIDGTNRVRLTTTDESDGGPDWSPDGTKIAWNRREAVTGANNDVWVMNADGTGAVNLTPDAPTAVEQSPAWSPDGTKIAFWSNRDAADGGGFDIYVINADGTNLRRLTNAPGNDALPAWSSDGRYIVFDSMRDGQREIYGMQADGSAQTRVTNVPASADYYAAPRPCVR